MLSTYGASGVPSVACASENYADLMSHPTNVIQSCHPWIRVSKTMAFLLLLLQKLIHLREGKGASGGNGDPQCNASIIWSYGGHNHGAVWRYSDANGEALLQTSLAGVYSEEE